MDLWDIHSLRNLQCSRANGVFPANQLRISTVNHSHRYRHLHIVLYQENANIDFHDIEAATRAQLADPLSSPPF